MYVDTNIKNKLKLKKKKCPLQIQDMKDFEND